MQLDIVQRLSEQQLVEGLRCVPVAGSEVLPYRDCTIEMRAIDPKDVYPAQFYCLNNILTRLSILDSELSKQGESINRIRGALAIIVDGHNYHLLPPIVEQHFAMPLPIVCDGVHRLLLAHQRGLACEVAWIAGVCLPYYGEPNPRGWRDVNIYEDFTTFVHSGRAKRIPSVSAMDGISLFRDLNTPFPNSVITEDRGWR